MLSADQKKVLGLLRKVPLLAGLANEVLERLATSAKGETFKARQVVYLPGDRSYGVHLIVEGRVKVSKVTRDGKELTLAYRTSGDFFGEACVLDGGPREEMVESMESTATVELVREEFERLMHDAPEFTRRLTLALMQRQRELEAKVEQLIFKDVGSKLAELLLRLGDEHGVAGKRGITLSVKITHQEMANLIGSTRETVSLTLSQFKRKGYIDTEGRRVILADVEALKALA
ncbi:MAG: Crp/Fnr family transcriptional regulator [Myxococcales bacterium]|nr:Crp/Fnr family transcriptional regulator [Myxococcales bacterium]